MSAATAESDYATGASLNRVASWIADLAVAAIAKIA